MNRKRPNCKDLNLDYSNITSSIIPQHHLANGINSMSHAYNDTLPVVGFTTQYDLSGNKMFERELHAETRSSLYQPFDSEGIPQGGYDSADRLRKALRGELSSDGGYTATGGGNITTPIALPNTDTSRDYDLDGLGNWKQSDYIPVGGAATIDLRQHNKLNEITSRKVGNDTKVLFAYDKNGNLKEDGTLELSYDALNRLILVKRKSDGTIIGQYVYDALNRRISKTISNGGLTGDIPNGTTDYLYQNWQIVEELNGSASTTKQYVWGQYIDECIQLKTLTTTGPGSLPAGDYYPLQDLLYRTTALTDEEGSILEAYDYDVYGNTLIFSTAGTGDNWWADDAVQANYAACDVLFSGYRYDPESKLYQVRNREYYPTLGRWLQRDPIGFEGGNWNSYGFVHNSPSVFVDPLGLAVGLDDGIVMVGGALAAAAGQAAVDLSTGHLSSSAVYGSQMLGGMVGAETTYAIGVSGVSTLNPAIVALAPQIGGAAGSAASNLYTQTLDNMVTGGGINYGQLAGSAAKGAALAYVPSVKVKGVTSGRNSFEAISKSTLTKIRNGTIKNVSNKTIAKHLASQIVKDANRTIIDKGTDIRQRRPNPYHPGGSWPPGGGSGGSVPWPPNPPCTSGGGGSW